jgi:uncharacterized protein (TIGR02001 family)
MERKKRVITMKSRSLKLSFAAALLATAAVTMSAAYADDAAAAPSWGTLSAAFTVTSDYRFRGVSQNDKNITPQATINWTGPAGFYAGVWTSKANWSGYAYGHADGATPSYEIDIYGGKHFDLGESYDLNVEAYYYSYPDANKYILGPKKASFFEGIGQLSHTYGKLAVTLTGAVSPEWSLGGGTSGYVEGTLSYPLTDWLSVSTNVGHQWVDAAPKDYTHYDIGLTATYKGFSLDARYVGNDIKKADATYWMFQSKEVQDGFVATLTYNIASLF